MMILVPILAFVALVACSNSRSTGTREPLPPSKQAYILPAEITLDFAAERGDAGEVFVVGTTNLPDGAKLGAEVPFPKGEAQDFKMFVKSGRFRSGGFRDGFNPIPPGKHKIHVLAYFNEAWQSPDVLRIVGAGGTNLKGKPVKLKDPDVIDSDKIIDVTRVLQIPPLAAVRGPDPAPTSAESDESKTIALVKHAILTVDGSRSATDIEANIALFMKDPKLRPSAGWSAKNSGGTKYIVAYRFINGTLGEAEAMWEADTATKKIRYLNKYGKSFSWSPNY